MQENRMHSAPRGKMGADGDRNSARWRGMIIEMSMAHIIP